jgi:hypothetical protein
MHKGPIPKGMMVCHTCDNPPCVNPSHLFLGTNQDNIRDASRKGRLARRCGEEAFSAKLTWEQVRLIRLRHAAGVTNRQSATDFNMSVDQISNIVNNKHWKEHIHDYE